MYGQILKLKYVSIDPDTIEARNDSGSRVGQSRYNSAVVQTRGIFRADESLSSPLHSLGRRAD